MLKFGVTTNVVYRGRTGMMVSDLMRPVEYVVRRMDDLQDLSVYLIGGKCRALPVVDGRGQVIGMVTARDVLAATATSRRPLWDIGVGDIVAVSAFCTCASSADAYEAVRLMQRSRTRFLVALGINGSVVGSVGPEEILAHTSLNDGAASFGAADAVRFFKETCV